MKRILSAILTIAMVTGMLVISGTSILAGLTSYAGDEEAAADGTLFSTSFETDEDNDLLQSTLDENYISNVESTPYYFTKGPGLAVDFDSVDGSKEYVGSECKFNLFDGKSTTKYLTGSNTIWIAFALAEEAAVTSYDITSANDEPTRDPKDWTLYGSDNGTNWAALDVQTGVTWSARYQKKTFAFENTTSYLYYKLDVTKNSGGTYSQFSDFNLYSSASAEISVNLNSINGTADYGVNECKASLFDNNFTTKFLTANKTCWISFAINAKAVITSYDITSANDWDNRDPLDWTFYGSDDGTTWTALDTQAGVKWSARYQKKTFEFENTTSYLYYKLDVTKNNGGAYIQFSELKINRAASPSAIIVDPDSISGTTDYGAGECKANLFDDNIATKFLTANSTCWISFGLKTAAAITSYDITSANDWDNRDPLDWTFYGSNDGTTWTALDTQTGVKWSARYQKLTFEFVNTTPYLKYKIDVTKNNGGAYIQFAELKLNVKAEEEVNDGSPMASVRDFGPLMTDCNYAGAWTGTKCLLVYGKQTEKTDTYARNVIFQDLDIDVTKNTNLSYVIFPGLFDISAYDYEYTSCRVMVDLHFTDGTYLSELSAQDQYGSLMTPQGQIDGECLYTAQWNKVDCCIGDYALGKTIDRICVYFEMDACEDASQFMTFFDDITIENKAAVVNEHLSDYITILRGTNNDSAFSRGLCTPAVTVPNGFNFISPVTNESRSTACYKYQQNGSNNTLDSLSIMHAPSYWLGSWGTWQFMANTSVDTSAGTNEVTSAQISSDAREAEFSHSNETAHAHYYSVTFDEGSVASGVKVEVTPTSHCAYVRFTFPEGADNANVIFDCIWGAGSLTFADDGKSFTAISNHTSNGSTKLYICGEFDTEYESASVVNTKQGVVSFDEGTTVITMKLATSYISFDQAEHSMELEIGENGTFDSVFASAQSAWDELCGKIEIEGASYTELVNFYSSMYRLYCYPNLYSENQGTNEEEEWVYASPYKNGAKTEGILYVNNGFWDTYRTTWAAYSLFTPEEDSDYLNGIVQHYIDSGWVPRWICPAGINCMVGTSSDIIFADAYIKGIDFNYDAAWESMIENASAYTSNMAKGGRPESNTSPFVGYVTNATGEGYSSTMEGYINDYGLYRMASALGYEDEAEYYLNRCLKYTQMFNSDVGFFMGKSLTGVWSAASSATYNPARWSGGNGSFADYTESVGWVNAFSAVFDGNGLANLYGGASALADKLDVLFDDSMESMQNVVEGIGHEICEFKEVRMGQYEHNNQPSHHLIYTYAYTDEQYNIQKYTREALRHLYVGSEIGQGFSGDEDNGEMSGWYVFNALGFYPQNMASGEYVIGSPLFDKATIHLENGKDIVIVANNNSDENVYIQSCTMNGESYNKLFLTHEQLTSGCTLEFEMGSEPSDWGSGEDAKPTSITSGTDTATSLSDLASNNMLTSGAFSKAAVTNETQLFTGIADSAKLFDNDSKTYSKISDGDTIVFAGTAPTKLSMITLTSYTAGAAPTGFKLEVSNDDKLWVTVAKTTGVKYLFNQLTQPFAVPEDMRGMYLYYRVTLYGGTELAEVEFIGEKGTIDQLDKVPEGIIDDGDNDNDNDNGNDEPTPGTGDAVVYAAAIIAGVLITSAILVRKKIRV